MGRLRGGIPARGVTLRQRRRTGWDFGPGGAAATAIASSSSVILGAGATSLADGLTLARIRGHIQMYLKTSSVADGGFSGAFGIGITDTTAFGIGVTAVQKPLTDADWDGWLWYHFFSLRSGGIIDGGVAADHDFVNVSSAALRWDIDGKARRKLPEDQVIFGVIEVGSAGTATMTVDFDSRILLFLL